MRLVALDLSLSATGWAIVEANPAPHLSYGVIQSDKPRVGIDPSMARLYEIRRRVKLMTLGVAKPDRPQDVTEGPLTPPADFVVMEGLAFGANDPGAQERAGLAYIVRLLLWEANIPVLLVAPATLKKYTCGSGNAKKELMLKEVFRRYSVDVNDNNIADAVALIKVGTAIIEIEPASTNEQREVLKKLRLGAPWLNKFASQI